METIGSFLIPDFMKRGVGIIFLIAVQLANSGAFAQKGAIQRISFSSKIAKEGEGKYFLYTPKDFSKSKSYPVLIYLHSSMVVGQNLDQLKAEGIPKLLHEGTEFPFVVIAPQLPRSLANAWPLKFIDEFVDHAKTQLSIDVNRIYFVGYNKGANAVMSYAATNPEKVACVVVVAGWAPPQNLCNMISVPTWIFHGKEDKVSPVVASRKLLASLKKCGGDVRLTEFDGLGHDCLKEAFQYPQLFDWIAARDKKQIPIPPGTKVVLTSNLKAYKLSKALAEVSGVIRTTNGEFYAINQRGNSPVLLNFDSLGKIKRVIRVAAANLDWQDVATSPSGDAFIADVGNVDYTRKHFEIYRFPQSDLEKDIVTPVKVEFEIPGSNPLHFSAAFWKDNYIYLIGKSKSSAELHIVKVPLGSTGEKAFEVGIGKGINMNSVSSAFWDAATQRLILLSSDKIAIVKNFADDSVDKLDVSYRPFPYDSRKEALVMFPDGSAGILDQHFLGTKDGNFYVLKMD